MPVQLGRDVLGHYFAWGEHGHKYRFQETDPVFVKFAAYQAAARQGRAIKASQGLQFRLSHSKNKKYDVYIKDLDKWLPFGDKRYEHYKTSSLIPEELHIYPEHRDEKRRASYRRRASKITDKDGELTYEDPHSANYYAYRYLW